MEKVVGVYMYEVHKMGWLVGPKLRSRHGRTVRMAGAQWTTTHYLFRTTYIRVFVLFTVGVGALRSRYGELLLLGPSAAILSHGEHRKPTEWKARGNPGGRDNGMRPIGWLDGWHFSAAKVVRSRTSSRTSITLKISNESWFIQYHTAYCLLLRLFCPNGGGGMKKKKNLVYHACAPILQKPLSSSSRASIGYTRDREDFINSAGLALHHIARSRLSILGALRVWIPKDHELAGKASRLYQPLWQFLTTLADSLVGIGAQVRKSKSMDVTNAF